jgi:glycosyltransferase involved in cell wall biosynthesis
VVCQSRKNGLRLVRKNILPTERVAVCIPCLNEEATVAEVVQGFRKSLPQAHIYVFDNASTDGTVRRAEKAGATVICCPVRGKGNVVRDIFRKVDTDWLIMVDGDATYDPAAAPRLLQAAVREEVDMLVGKRCTPVEESCRAYRPMHQLGNRMVCGLIRSAFRVPLQDVFSGYRVFSRTFAKTIPLHSGGFEVETELTLQAISKNFKVLEMETEYKARPPGSFSKLNTYRDGMLVLSSFLAICRFYRPMLFFGACGLLLGGLSLIAGTAPIMDYMQYRWVYRVPLAILAMGLAILSSLSFSIGLILETQLKYHNELFNLIRNNLKERRKSTS